MLTFFQGALNSAQTAFQDIRDIMDKGVDEEAMKEKLFASYYRENLQIYTPKNIHICVELLIRRVKEHLESNRQDG